MRELENVIERAVILADGPTLTARDFSDLSVLDADAAAGCRESGAAAAAALSVEDYIAEFVRRHQDRYSEQELAAMLGIGRKALWVRRNRWGFSAPAPACTQRRFARTRLAVLRAAAGSPAARAGA